MTYARRIAFGLFAGLLITSLAAFAAGPEGTAPTPALDEPAVAETAQVEAPTEIIDATIPALGNTAEPEPQACTGYPCSSDYDCRTYCGQVGGQCGFFTCPNVCYCYF